MLEARARLASSCVQHPPMFLWINTRELCDTRDTLPSTHVTMLCPAQAFDMYLEVLGLSLPQVVAKFGSERLSQLAKYHFVTGAALPTRGLRSGDVATALPGYDVTISK
jgi:hypothetical protein